MTDNEGQVRTPVLHHINLKTTRLQELIDWYGTVLGTRVNHQFEGGAWLTNDEANHRIALIAFPSFVEDPDRGTHTGMHHCAYEYPALDDLLATYVRLRDAGITPGGCLDHGLTTSFYYRDPDGNYVELQVDNYGDWAQSTAFLCDDERFAANPIGAPIDPEALVVARADGLSPLEIHERGYRGDYPPTEPLDLGLPI